MVEVNGNRTIHEYLRHIDTKLDRLHDKLDAKVDKTDHVRLKDRVGSVENKVQFQEVKTAGIAGAMSVLAIWIKNFFGG